MKMAEVTSELSYAKRQQVGAVIVKDTKILATGYNGMPSGWENACETVTEKGLLVSKPEVLHAETNAIAKIAQSTESSQDATLFCTLAPCLQCAKLIYQSGIKTVYYKEKYHDESGLKFLELSGVNVHQFDNSL